MIKQFKICNIADIVLLSIGIILLLLLVFSSTKMNIVADSIDYYSILQRLTPEKEVPIVRNLHFAEQRSPGYSIFSLIPYSLISIVIEPLVKTEKITEYDLDKSRVSIGLYSTKPESLEKMIKMQYENILKKLKTLSDPKAVEGMARFGINPKSTYGVSVPNLRKMAKEIGRDHPLAQQLWDSGFHAVVNQYSLISFV